MNIANLIGVQKSLTTRQAVFQAGSILFLVAFTLSDYFGAGRHEAITVIQVDVYRWLVVGNMVGVIISAVVWLRANNKEDSFKVLFLFIGLACYFGSKLLGLVIW